MKDFWVIVARTVLFIFLIFTISTCYYLVWTFPNESSFDPLFWKNRWSYYATLGVAFSSIVGIFGVFLGLFYYFHKLKHERDQKARSDHQQYIRLVLDALNKFDVLVMDFLFFDLKESAAFNRIKSEIATSFDDIYSLLDNAAVHISDEDVSVIIAVNNYIDKSPLVTAQNLEKFYVLSPSDFVTEFRRQLTMSKDCCYKCMVNSG